MFSMIKKFKHFKKTDFHKHSEQKLGPKAKESKNGAFSRNETFVKITF